VITLPNSPITTSEVKAAKSTNRNAASHCTGAQTDSGMGH